jgi:hypothetical protein
MIACAGALTGVLIDGWPNEFRWRPCREPVGRRTPRSINPIIELPLNLDVDSAPCSER